MEIVINDRRGKNKEVVERPEQALKSVADSPLSTEPRTWKDVGYYIVQVQTPVGIMTIGHAAGWRSDDLYFRGDYAFPPVWTPDAIWQPMAKKRLDTFLTCTCTYEKMCATHKMYYDNWGKADQERVDAVMQAPLPPSIEGIMRREQQAKQSQIVVPGGPRQ